MDNRAPDIEHIRKLVAIETERTPIRFRLSPFNSLAVGTERIYLVKGLIPRTGIVVIWGPPKCGKSFWAFDLAMHIALGWEYRSRRVQQGPVVYCAFEGADGFRARAEAFRSQRLTPDIGDVPFYLLAARASLALDHVELIAAIRAQLPASPPIAVYLDTLNRSLNGSENDDKDMGAYVRAADAIREAFDCAVIIVHHCGIEGSRPRGHTSLTGAADAQLAVKRDTSNNILVTVEWMKDGPEGDSIASRLESVEVGTDADGDTITSCVVVPADPPQHGEAGPRLTKNQQTMFAILHGAGDRGLSQDDWNDKCREAGIGSTRRADLFDIRMALQSKGLIYKSGNAWMARQ